MRKRRTKDRHDSVADELLHGSAKALDVGAEAGMVWTDAGVYILGIGPVR